MRTIICTTGTSIAAGGNSTADEQAYRTAIRARLGKLKEELGDGDAFLRRASAETNSLSRLNVTADDYVVFLHTETDEGHWCASEIQRLVKDAWSIEARLVCVDGLQVKDARRFRREGIQNLFRKIDLARNEHPQHDVILNATGGFKSVVPYLTLYGLLEQIPVVYIFERSESLLHLPPVPVNYDYERLSQAHEALTQLERQSVMPKEEFFGLIPGLEYHQRAWYESLLEEEDGNVTLSSFGVLMADRMRGDQARVYLSPQAGKSFEESSSEIRKQFTILLERVKEPLWRRSTIHSFAGTDLTVFKPGNTSCRAACILQGQNVYVCELYQHDEYERDLPKRKKAQYDLREFKPWIPPADSPPLPTTEEEATRQLIERCEQWEAKVNRLQEEKSQLESLCADFEQEGAVHAKRAEQLEGELKQSRTKIDDLQQQVTAQQQRAVQAEGALSQAQRESADCQQRVQQLEQELAVASRPWWRKLLGLPPVTEAAPPT